MLLVSTLATVATAQTGAVNPQSPARRVDSVRPRAKVQEDAARLDALLLRGLQKKGEQPLPETDDATFLRRAFLSIVGPATASSAVAALSGANASCHAPPTRVS